MSTRSDDLRAHLVRLIIESGEGNLGPADLAKSGGSLRTLNYSSLAYMRLIDAIENELGVCIDPEADIELFASVESILGLVAAELEQADA
jgi:acyl carrier protein